MSAVVGNFKSMAARCLNLVRKTPGAPVWLRNYYEHIIRDDADLDRIREYIVRNPQKWELDEDNPHNLNLEQVRRE